MPRFPTTIETSRGTRKAYGPTAYTNRVLRWLGPKGIDPWFPRRNARKANRPHTVNIEQEEPETVGEQDLPPAQPGPYSNNLPGGLFKGESCSSTETQHELEVTPYTPYYIGQPSTVSRALREKEQQVNHGTYLGSQFLFSFDPYAYLPNTAYPPIFLQQSTEQYIEDHGQPQPYGGQTYPAFNSASANDFLGTSGISSNTKYSLSDGGGFLGDMISW